MFQYFQHFISTILSLIHLNKYLLCIPVASTKDHLCSCGTYRLMEETENEQII